MTKFVFLIFKVSLFAVICLSSSSETKIKTHLLDSNEHSCQFSQRSGGSVRLKVMFHETTCKDDF